MNDLKLAPLLQLPRCPHCSIHRPNLSRVHQLETRAHDGSDRRFWSVYLCSGCGSLVSAYSYSAPDGPAAEWFPMGESVDEAIPAPASDYLKQARQSLHAPAGAVMLAASAVDAMLKAKGYTEGNLYARIDNAATKHLITADMAKWAHQVRLDANDQRHADQGATLPKPDDAKRCVEFAEAIAQFIFVLPSRVTRGVQESTPAAEPQN